MQITISKSKAKNLQKAIYLIVQTCNKTRGEQKFKPNEKIMKDIGISVKGLHELHKVSEQIEKKLKSKIINKN